MSATTLPAGRYWIGNPLSIFPEWTPNDTFTYTIGNCSFHAFKYGDSYVAAIPDKAIPKDAFKSKKVPKSFVSLEHNTVFWEVDGTGQIGTINLGTISDEISPDVSSVPDVVIPDDEPTN
jgi:hypothetical protein